MIISLKNSKDEDIISTIKPQVWKEYFREMLIEGRVQFQDPNLQNITVITVTGRPVRLRLEEIRKICKATKTGKSRGPRYISGQLLKHGTNKLYEHLKTF